MGSGCHFCKEHHIVRPYQNLPKGRCYCNCHSYKVDEFGKRVIEKGLRSFSNGGVEK